MNEFSEDKTLEILGARENNLKNIDLSIPRNALVVITGISGSGKSSLAFDTIYAEGQRRYMESFSAYARQFIGNMERPDVDKITGLSPVISIEQKSVNKNPRSTVGTITEIYDFLRLLYARIGEAYSYNTGEKMVRYSEEQITDLILKEYEGRKIIILAPSVRGRKGHYRELFEHIRQAGFTRVRIDGELREIEFGMMLDRYKTHDIEIVIDRIEVREDCKSRIGKSVQTAFRYGKGLLMVLDSEELGMRSVEYPLDDNYSSLLTPNSSLRYFSRLLMCPTTGLSYEDPEPNTFSFNSPYGACPKCSGMGEITVVDKEKLIPNPELSIKKGGLAPAGEYKAGSWIFKQLEAIGLKYGFTLDTPMKEISDEALDVILYGTNETFEVKREYIGINSIYKINFEGIINFIESQNNEDAPASIARWANSFMNHVPCPVCNGTRLKKEAQYFLIDGKNIAEVAEMDTLSLCRWIEALPKKLTDSQNEIGKEILREINKRVHFLLDIGIDYLSLNRPAASLSGGEAQRIRLATQIGSQLTGVLYILDEPSIGLHQRDNHRLIESLKELRDQIALEDAELAANQPTEFDEYGGLLTSGRIIRVKGTVSRRDDEPCKIICDAILPASEAVPAQDNRKKSAGQKTPRGLYLRLKNDSCAEYIRAMQIIDIFDGPDHLFIKFTDTGKIVRDPDSKRVDANPVMIRELCKRIGAENVVFVE